MSSLRWPEADDRLNGGVAVGPVPYSFASSLYCRDSQHAFVEETRVMSGAGR
jgi:hypothetical protein